MTRALLASIVLAAGMSLCQLSFRPANAAPAPSPAVESGVIRVKSANDVDETLKRLKADIAPKQIRFFSERQAFVRRANAQRIAAATLPGIGKGNAATSPSQLP